MEVTNINDVKIYNLSCSKTLPDWLSDRKKRRLLKKDVSLRKRIELIQDLEMPQVCDHIKVSRDGQYIMVTGLYKPRIRCYDVRDLALKFERFFDSEVVQFHILSDDYTKLVFLLCDRYVEFHSQFGHYFRLRIPKFGRDLAYHNPSCDLYFAGDTSEIIRLNLEKGQFLNPYQGNSTCYNAVKINPCHNLLVCGSSDGQVEAWDPRDRKRVGILDCAMSSLTPDTEVFPSVTSLSFKDGINMGVGTATGVSLLYDLRANKPYIVKDHMYGLPISKIEFCPSQDLVLSMDQKILKLWSREDGKPFTSLQAHSDLNDFCLVPDTGMIFLAQEEKKIQNYFVPSLGPAPKWCSFLDGLVEELEETNEDTIYDDYKFVTIKELEDLGLSHLIGTNLLRAYMHGFFIDIRLYNKTRVASHPFAYEEYKKKKIRQIIDKQRNDRVELNNKLPKVNKELAKKLIESETDKKGRKNVAAKLLKDDRFKALFEDTEFEIEENK